jgi:hypothetical protein
VAKKKPQIFSLSISQLVENFFYLNGDLFSFADYPWMRSIYDIDPFELVLKTSRQTSKSSTLANILPAKSIVMPGTNDIYKGGFKSLYIAPTVDQTKIFSHERLAPVVEGSPFIKDNFINSTVIQNVFSKYLLNGSKMNLRYSLLTADRIRGISTDFTCFDETQDLLEDNIGIIQQCAARSLYKHSIFAGTPKRTIGALASRWARSTKNEWFARCTSCSKYNFLDKENIREHGLVCRYCEKPLDPKPGLWVRTSEGAKKDNATGDYITEGFRVSVLMFANAPWVNWQRDVWLPMQERPEAVFLNEFLGLEFDSGALPVTEDEIRACCTGGRMKLVPDEFTRSYPTTLGIDYGPINSANSRTVLTVLQRRGEIEELVYAKKYEGKESDYGFIHDDVPRQMQRWSAALIGADYGLGEGPNAEIRKRIGDATRLIAFQHLGNQKNRWNWNPRMNAYTLGRNTIMTEFFHKIKNRKIVFPCWEDFAPFAKDISSVIIDYDTEKNKFKYTNSDPDDTVHSTIYGSLAGEILRHVYNNNG